MDPATAAGLGLAVMSLAAQCFAGAMQAIDLISSAKNMEPEFRYLAIRLRLEQHRLYNWSDEIGLVEFLEKGASKPRHCLLGLNFSTVLDTLKQIQALASNFIKYETDFGGLVPAEDGWELDTLQENKADDESVRFPDTMRFLKKAKHIVPIVHSLPRRLKWASFYKDKYEKLIDRLHEFNNILTGLVDHEARVSISRSTRETYTTILHLHSKVDELIELNKALKPTTSGTSSTPTPRGPLMSHDSRAHEFAELANFKAFNTAVQAETYYKTTYTDSYYRPLEDLRIDRYNINLLSSIHGRNARCEATYKSSNDTTQRVWIEWREYDQAMQANPRGNSYNLDRVNKLVALLRDREKPEQLRVPNCLGYFDDAQNSRKPFYAGRLGFVFEQPLQTGVPVSLRELLGIKTKPELTERIALGRVLANCLMSLHSVDWLHKGLRSDNIVFFYNATGSDVDYSCPLLSGFAYARPAFREDMTELPSLRPEHDMYRHPKTHGLGPWEGRQGFKRTFDIYSLGIILLEIATWQPVDELLTLGDPKELDDDTLANIQKRLLNEGSHLDAVGANAGRRFKDATRSCLMGSAAFDIDEFDDEKYGWVTAKISQNFYWKVIRPLEGIQT